MAGRRKISEQLAFKKWEEKCSNPDWIVTNIFKMIEEDERRREANPHLPWGLSLKMQIAQLENENDYEFTQHVETFKNLYPGKSDEYYNAAAFVRFDRIKTEIWNEDKSNDKIVSFVERKSNGQVTDWPLDGRQV